jgi:hypothetical protein
VLDRVVRFLGSETGASGLASHNILPLPVRAEGKVARVVRDCFLNFIQGCRTDLQTALGQSACSLQAMGQKENQSSSLGTTNMS